MEIFIQPRLDIDRYDLDCRSEGNSVIYEDLSYEDALIVIQELRMNNHKVALNVASEGNRDSATAVMRFMAALMSDSASDSSEAASEPSSALPGGAQEVPLAPVVVSDSTEEDTNLVPETDILPPMETKK